MVGMHMMTHVPARIEPTTFRRKSRISSSELRCHKREIKYLNNIPMQFWPFYYQWKWMKSKEHDQTRVPKPLPAEIKRSRLQGFSNISVQLNFTGTRQNVVWWNIDIHEAQIFKFKIRGFEVHPLNRRWSLHTVHIYTLDGRFNSA